LKSLFLYASNTSLKLLDKLKVTLPVSFGKYLLRDGLSMPKIEIFQLQKIKKQNLNSQQSMESNKGKDIIVKYHLPVGQVQVALIAR